MAAVLAILKKYVDSGSRFGSSEEVLEAVLKAVLRPRQAVLRPGQVRQARRAGQLGARRHPRSASGTPLGRLRSTLVQSWRPGNAVLRPRNGSTEAQAGRTGARAGPAG